MCSREGRNRGESITRLHSSSLQSSRRESPPPLLAFQLRTTLHCASKFESRKTRREVEDVRENRPTMAMRITFVGLLVALGLLAFLSKGTASSDGKVAVDFYSESLCPYCSNFVVNYLSKIVKNDVIDIVDLRIIPYGNAHIYDDGEMVCQHGEDECKLNLIQTCAVRLWPNLTQWFPFILCLETLVEALPRSEVYPHWKTCVEPSGLSLELLEKCSEGPLGNKLEMEFATETANLIPPHQYVPWVVVDGTPLYDDYVYIEKAVCQAYKGYKALPYVCERYNGAGNTMIESALRKENSKSGVCERD